MLPECGCAPSVPDVRVSLQCADHCLRSSARNENLPVGGWADVTLRIDRRVLQQIAALATLIAALVIAWEGKWVFAETLPVTKTDPTFAQQIFSDRATIGFVRFAFVMLAVFLIVVVALRAGMRSAGLLPRHTG